MSASMLMGIIAQARVIIPIGGIPPAGFSRQVYHDQAGGFCLGRALKAISANYPQGGLLVDILNVSLGNGQLSSNG
ncbi:MAG: hypothetical protein PVG32_18665 [Anaerolineales bacterium]|jgi:hypothetical protein